MITVNTLDGAKKVKYQQGMTAADALKAAKVEVTDEISVTVNEGDADLETKIADKDEITVVPNADNG